MAALEEIRRRYREVNGDHPVTPADEEYVRRLFVPLDDDDGVHDLVLRRRLPLPSYLLVDGTPMVHPGHRDLLDAAGGPDLVERWFASHWPAEEQEVAAEEWEAYLSGRYVCLYEVTPQTIRAKTRLIEQIKELLTELEGTPSDDVRERLRDCVDELDALEPPFAPDYDRHRFGGPLSREVWIDDVRVTHLTGAVPPATGVIA
jgi:hypothetical protein